MGLLDRFFNKKKHINKNQPLVMNYNNISGGSLVSPDTAMNVSAYYRGVIFISSQIAKLPFEIKGEKNKRFKNKIYNLLNKQPNPESNAFNFKSAMIQTAIGSGNAYAEIERTLSGEPVAIWILPQQNVSLYRNQEGELLYRVSNLRDGEVYLPKEDILHIRNIHTKDGIMGQGVAAYGKDILGIAIGSDKFANSMYANSGIPSGVLESPGKLSAEAYSRIKDSWKDTMGGRRTGGTALLEEGLSYKSVSLAPDVLQFLETRQFNVLEIARFLGVPPSKLYDPETQKLNNVEQGGLDVANDTISVWAVNLEQEVDNKLLVGKYQKLSSGLDMYALFRADMNTRATYFGKMMSNAAMTPNQIREKEGEEPYEGGDRYYIATNNFSPVDRIDEIVDKQVSTPATKGMGDEGIVPPEADTNSGAVENKLERALTKYYEQKTK